MHIVGKLIHVSPFQCPARLHTKHVMHQISFNDLAELSLVSGRQLFLFIKLLSAYFKVIRRLYAL